MFCFTTETRRARRLHGGIRFSVYLRISAVNKVLEFFLSLVPTACRAIIRVFMRVQLPIVLRDARATT